MIRFILGILAIIVVATTSAMEMTTTMASMIIFVVACLVAMSGLFAMEDRGQLKL